MPRPRYTNLDADKQARLLNAATREFAAHGYELASVNTILDMAEMSKGAFYYYFDDKADLAGEVFRVLVTSHIASLGQLRDVQSVNEFWRELRRLSFVRLKALESNRADYEAMVRIAKAMPRDSALAQRITPMFVESRKMMSEFFQRGLELGALRKDLPLGLLIHLIETAKTTASQALWAPDDIPTDAELESFTDLVLDLAVRIAAPKKKEIAHVRAADPAPRRRPRRRRTAR